MNKGVTMKLKTKILICLIILALFDAIIPVPFTAIFLIYILIDKPDWFRKLVSEVYESC